METQIYLQWTDFWENREVTNVEVSTQMLSERYTVLLVSNVIRYEPVVTINMFCDLSHNRFANPEILGSHCGNYAVHSREYIIGLATFVTIYMGL